jgi:hypothetical protein
VTPLGDVAFLPRQIVSLAAFDRIQIRFFRARSYCRSASVRSCREFARRPLIRFLSHRGAALPESE